MHGPVGMAFAVSMAVLGAIGILHWMHESSNNNPNGFLSNSTIQGQLQAFMNMPTVLKLLLVVVVLILPVAIGAFV